MRILMADSGSTKTDWCVLDNGTPTQLICTRGTNPYMQTPDEIGDEIAVHLLPVLGMTSFDAVYFYGAGCVYPDKIALMHHLLSARLPVRPDRIEIGSDMLAAARALCGHEPGIACILGTGSNSCFYNGVHIVENISPLGYILGDEGSGAYLGKRLIGDLLKNQASHGLRETFLARYHLQPSDIIDRVYRQPLANRFLAGFAPFLAEHIEDPYIHGMILSSFEQFLLRNPMQYDYRKYRIHFVGSIAFHFQQILHAAAHVVGAQLGQVLKSPMDGLVRFHQSA
ncbi:MAG: ATPase [Prevotellaceae bacterium]|jgi:N-acetylglucosamine kinase-like BadF-type ATPase|nr:ATPase [Prevotellaceae bacterium]